jgi:hypothetical protein
MNGKTNNTGTFTLNTGNATTTTIYDERIGYDSIILWQPQNASAATQGAFSYGAFQDTTTQTIASTTTAYPITFNTTDADYGCYLGTPSSRIYVRNSGMYNLQWSGQFSSLDNAPQDVFVWIRKNGVDVAGSTGVLGLPARKNTSDPFHNIFGWNFFLSLNQGDYIELVWSAESTAISIVNYPATGSPTKPSTASVVATMNYISSDDVGIGFNGMYVLSRSKGSAVIKHFANDTPDKTFGYIVHQTSYELFGLK